MNISKELHDTMMGIGFSFEPLKVNQPEPNFLIAKIYFLSLEQEFLVRVENNANESIFNVIDRLVQSVHKIGHSDGIITCKKEIGGWIK